MFAGEFAVRVDAHDGVAAVLPTQMEYSSGSDENIVTPSSALKSILSTPGLKSVIVSMGGPWSSSSWPPSSGCGLMAAVIIVVSREHEDVRATTAGHRVEGHATLEYVVAVAAIEFVRA